jgi:hypothetical protein
LAGTATVSVQYGQRHMPPAKASSTEIFFEHEVQRIFIAISSSPSDRNCAAGPHTSFLPQSTHPIQANRQWYRPQA